MNISRCNRIATEPQPGDHASFANGSGPISAAGPQVVTNQRGEHGSTLLATMMVVVILSTSLAGYLQWVHAQNRMTMESQAWNSAMACAEAGIEEGLAQINVGFGTNYYDWAATNWGGSLAQGYFGPRTNAINAGSYSAVIVPVVGQPGPTIISTGYTTLPINGHRLVRVVRVNTRPHVAFGSAITVRSNLTTKGTTMTVDSFDSADPNHSTNGMYNPLTRKDGGDVNSTSGLINVQNAEIYGKLRVGPGASYSIGNGLVGSLDWTTKGQIEPGWYEDDFNAEIKDVPAPYTTGIDVPSTTYKTNKYYIVGSGPWYHAGDFTMQQNEVMYVYGNATLYVTGSFKMMSQNECEIRIMPGASLKLFVGTEDGAETQARLTMVNTLGNASAFQFYGLPSTTQMSWSGNNTYVGTVYAPEANVTMGGGGSSYYDYQGSVVANSAILNGHFDVHYDENLKRLIPPTGFTVVSWQEL